MFDIIDARCNREVLNIIVAKCVYCVYAFIYLFMAYLMAVAVSLTVHLRMVGLLIIDICAEKPFVSKCEVIPQKMLGETEECH